MKRQIERCVISLRAVSPNFLHSVHHPFFVSWSLFRIVLADTLNDRHLRCLTDNVGPEPSEPTSSD